MPLKTLLVLIFLSYGLFSFTQTEEDYFGTWTVISGNNRISEKFGLTTEGVLRHYEFFEHYEFSFVRLGVNYQLAPNLTSTMGYAYLDSEPFVIDPETAGARQHWAFEELNLKNKLGNAEISHRYRLENRWILKDEGTDFNNRMRYRLQVRYPLGQKLYFIGFNEILLNLKNIVFNQNRINLGLGYTLNSSVKLELGYLKVHFSSKQCDSIRFAMIFQTDFRDVRGTHLVSR